MHGAVDRCHPEVVLRCLIVDDSPGFLEAARGLLTIEGICVVGVASTGAQALRQVEELRPDIALVDIELGAESGFEIATQLHRQGDPGAPKVILVSTHAEQDYRDLIAASPAVGFVPKSALSARAVFDLLERQR
jgi:DNA-binding NarL/FixJ family response regulator